MRLLLRLFCFLFAVPCLVLALHADEAYQIDYQHALLGRPVKDNTFFHQPSATSKASLIYTLSEKNVLGALNPKDGSVVWRQQLSSTSPRGILRAVNQTDLIYTAVDNKISSWDASNGRLVAEWYGEGKVKSMELHEVDPLVVFEGNGVTTLVRLNSANAKMMWEVKDASGEIPLAMTTSPKHVYYLSLVSKLLKGYQIKVTKVDPFSAQPSDHLTLDSQDDVSSAESILHIGANTESPILAWADKSFKTLKLNVLGNTAITTVNIATHDGKAPVRISVHTPTSPKAAGHLLVAYQAENAHWAEVYHIDGAKGAIKKAYDIPKLAGCGAFAVSVSAGKIYFVRHGETEISVYSSDSNTVLERWTVQTKLPSGSSQKLIPYSAIAEVVPKGPTKFAVRSMLTLDIGDVALIRNGVHDWTRSESLAGIVAAAWADVSQTESLVQSLEAEIYANFVSAYIHRVTRHIRDLQHLPGWLIALPQRILSSFGLGVAPLEQFSADPFGFRKLIIVATKDGRVAAIDSGSQGQVLWNIQATEIAQGLSWDVDRIIVRGDLIWILATDASQSISLSLSGDIKTDWPTKDITGGSRLLPVTTTGSSTMVTVSEDGVPSFKSTTGEESVTIVTRRKDGSLSGWTSSGEQAIKTWDFIPQAGHEIAATIARPEHDPIASVGRALGDRNVLYKFLSPNLLLVVTLSRSSSSASATLLDTITGQALVTAEHKDIDISKGVSGTFSENWFAYVLQSDPVLAGLGASGKSKSSLLNIMELYESPIANDRGPLGPNGTFSSADTYPPHVASASFIISNTIANLTTTSTKQGITPRSILAYVPSLAALIAIPIGVLAPRRPVGRDPTPAEREEGLFRYLPVVDIMPVWTLSHKREVLGIKNIISTPSDMESTSLVFSYGDLDIFGTRTAPIGAFDMLGKGFNKIQLVLTVVALAIGTGVLAPLVRKKQIDGLWRT